MLLLATEEHETHSSFAFDASEALVVLAVLFAAFAVVVFLIAATSILRASYLSGTAQLVWIVGCLMAPVLVPTLWFTVGRVEAQRRSTPADG